MCFSPEASFAAAAALLPAGGYCIASAWLKQPRLLPLAIVPLVFGVQQFCEGFVWRGLERGDPELIRGASLAFLFFALAFWPFWFPFLTAVMELEPRRKKLFIGLTIAASIWFWILYYPIITGPDSVLRTHVVHHSIQYDFDGLEIYQYVPRPILRVFYFLCVALPMAFGSESLGRTAGLVFGISAVVSAIVFNYAFVSVWCFFAAILAGYLCYVFYHLPGSGTNEHSGN